MVGCTKNMKGKAIVLEEWSKAPVVGSGTGKPSHRNSTTLLFPELHSELHLIFKYEGVWIYLLALCSYRDSMNRWISQGKSCPLAGDQNQLKNLRVAVKTVKERWFCSQLHCRLHAGRRHVTALLWSLKMGILLMPPGLRKM